MGCDIHMFAEKIDGRTGKWRKVGYVFPYPYYNADQETKKYVEEDGEIYWSNKKKTDEPYHSRNYDLFAMLANVRNGYGFAGCDTGNGFIPIAMPRGLPEDVSPTIKTKSDRWGCDGHSHSYFTIKELLDYDWDMHTVHRGWVSPAEYIIYLIQGKPQSWAGGVDGGQVKHTTEAEMKEYIKGFITDEEIEKEVRELDSDNDFREVYKYVEELDKKIRQTTGVPGEFTINDEKSYYTQVQWVEPYRDSVKEFLDETVPRLEELGEPDKVRIVFWFDN